MRGAAEGYLWRYCHKMARILSVYPNRICLNRPPLSLIIEKGYLIIKSASQAIMYSACSGENDSDLINRWSEMTDDSKDAEGGQAERARRLR